MSDIFPRTSATLLRDLRHGPAAAGWGEFVQLYRPGLIRACLAARLDASTAEDIAQTVLLKLVENLHQYDSTQAFRPWLNSILRHTLLDHWKSAWNRKARLAADEDDAAWLGNLADSMIEKLASDEGLLIHVAIDQVRAEVSDRDWEVFRRRHLLEEDVAEVAAALGITSVNVSVITARFRSRLKTRLAGMDAAS